MKGRKIIWNILKRTHAIKILYGYIALFVCISLAIMLFEPKINTFIDSVWYCFSVISTIGFGDITVTTITAKILTIVLSIISILVVALIPGILTSYYIEIVKLRENESSEKFLYDLEHLPELSHEELEALSNKVKEFQKKRKH